MTMLCGSLARSMQWLTQAGSSGILRAPASRAAFQAAVSASRSCLIQRCRRAIESASTLFSSAAVNADMIASVLPVIARSQGKPRIG